MGAGHTNGAEPPFTDQSKGALHPCDRDDTRREPSGGGTGKDETDAAVVFEPDWEGGALGAVDSGEVGEVDLERETVLRTRLEDEGVWRVGEAEGDVAGIVAGFEGVDIPFDVDGCGLARWDGGGEAPCFHVVGLVRHGGDPVVRRAVDEVDFATETHV